MAGVDFIKAVSKEAPEGIRSHPYLNFTIPINPETGEVKKRANYVEADYHNMVFRIYDSGRFYLLGSIHKLANQGVHNYDIFSYPRLVKTLEFLKETFNINLFEMTLENIEFGFNVVPPISCKKVIDNLILHKSRRFKHMALKNGDYAQAAYSNYMVKIYSKSKHYKLSSEVLRIEIKYTEMVKMNKLGISCMADLFDVAKLRMALEVVKDQWRRVKLFDPTLRKDELTKVQREKKILEWSNVKWWTNLSSNYANAQKKLMERVFENHSNNIKKAILESMDEMTKTGFQFSEVFRRDCNTEKETEKNQDSEMFRSSYIVLNPSLNTSIICSHFDVSQLVDMRPRIPKDKIRNHLVTKTIPIAV